MNGEAVNVDEAKKTEPSKRNGTPRLLTDGRHGEDVSNMLHQTSNMSNMLHQTWGIKKSMNAMSTLSYKYE